MAIDVKEIIVSGLLSLVETQSLEKLTVKDILEKTGVSRQTFYNHFQDKNDLIQYIYMTKIIPDYNNGYEDIRFYDSLLNTFNRMKEYHVFMKQACMIEGQNCLKDYIFEHCREFDLKWHQELYGDKPMPDNLKFAIQYHATASSSMALSWILSDMPASCEEMAALITNLRNVGMDTLFADGEHKNPYRL